MGSNHYFFFLHIFLIIHTIKNIHTITSPNSIIAIAPPIEIANIINNTNMINVVSSNKNRNTIITPFIKEYAFIAKIKQKALVSREPLFWNIPLYEDIYLFFYYNTWIFWDFHQRIYSFDWRNTKLNFYILSPLLYKLSS